MHIKTPAKINLYLDITGIRPDGYHELISLMCCIGIHDTVRFLFDQPNAAGGLTVTCEHPDAPSDGDNLAFGAAEAFFGETGITPGKLNISIEKQIPVGAGLGGGSSNAAGVLRGLNRYYGNPVSTERLKELGAGLGADVPFFITGRPAVAKGIGEKLFRLEGLSPLPLIVIYPGRPVSTARVYKKFNLALTNPEKINKKSIFEPGWVANVSRYLFNALEPAAIKLCPEIGTAKQALLECGADGALMSGSGSSVFGIFADTGKAQRAYAKLSGCVRWRVFLTHLLT
ncbi:MAG: 4-(cytidine 5'-diphospho)-2-C-methyl-D-erythritol kinase [Desulfobacteraceae bacterium]|nr:4-(cytidine 5'-diphospho)-2-C-methyl-D-erythritol kinase [Desulfobacteraceae bacterium]